MRGRGLEPYRFSTPIGQRLRWTQSGFESSLDDSRPVLTHFVCCARERTRTSMPNGRYHLKVVRLPVSPPARLFTCQLCTKVDIISTEIKKPRRSLGFFIFYFASSVTFTVSAGASSVCTARVFLICRLISLAAFSLT